MPVLPIAAFLVGSLLTLLLPVALLIALTVWYWMYVAREPDPTEPHDAGTPPTAAAHPPRDPDPPASQSS